VVSSFIENTCKMTHIINNLYFELIQKRISKLSAQLIEMSSSLFIFIFICKHLSEPFFFVLNPDNSNNDFNSLNKLISDTIAVFIVIVLLNVIFSLSLLINQ
jgi:hypothetical protein